MVSESKTKSISMSSYRRMFLITTQIGMALDELTELSESAKRKYIEAIEEKKICAFHFYAKKYDEVCAELSFHINWEEYDRQIEAGNEIVKIKAKYNNGVLPPTNNYVQQFDKYIERNRFDLSCRFRYSKSVYDNNEDKFWNEKLGASEGTPLKFSKDFEDWTTNSDEYNLGGYGLSELSIKIKI